MRSSTAPTIAEMSDICVGWNILMEPHQMIAWFSLLFYGLLGMKWLSVLKIQRSKRYGQAIQPPAQVIQPASQCHLSGVVWQCTDI